MSQTQPDGFLATPASGGGAPVLVLHAWWGLNDTIKTVCTRLAEAGYLAFAPDLYHGKVADTIESAETLSGALEENYLQAVAEVLAAARFLDESAGNPEGGMAVLGFSLGAFYALKLADDLPARIRSVVLFYGTDGGFAGDFNNAQAAYLGHFAENDPYEPPSNATMLAETLRAAGRAVEFHQYNGVGHWFFEPDRADSYNEAAAQLAWERTLAFLERSTAKHSHLSSG